MRPTFPAHLLWSWPAAKPRGPVGHAHSAPTPGGLKPETGESRGKTPHDLWAGPTKPACRNSTDSE
ncbi:hypothetical protein GCM10027563_25650 [Parasphingorhabdus pacifica]